MQAMKRSQQRSYHSHTLQIKRKRYKNKMGNKKKKTTSRTFSVGHFGWSWFVFGQTRCLTCSSRFHVNQSGTQIVKIDFANQVAYGKYARQLVGWKAFVIFVWWIWLKQGVSFSTWIAQHSYRLDWIWMFEKDHVYEFGYSRLTRRTRTQWLFAFDIFRFDQLHLLHQIV